MEKNRICFLSDFCYCEKDIKKKELLIKNYLSLKDDHEIEWNDNNPDYLFVNETFYYGKYSAKLRKMYNRIIKCNPVTIFVAGECIEPDFNVFDYAIVFDRNLKLENRVIRYPTFLRFRKSIFEKENKMTLEDAKKELNQKKYFCNFIYSNSMAHINRDKLFHEITKYKPVNSLGKHLNNFKINDEKIDSISDWRLQSIKLKGLHKFSIASENAAYNGYVSEKLITSLESHSIPIYFGDQTVNEEFNEKAFINFKLGDDWNELLERIKKIDNDDELWCKMICEPWQTEEQRIKSENEITNYYNFIDKLFEKKEFKKAEGFHPSNYRNAFKIWRGNEDKKIKYNRYKSKIKRLLK